LDDNSNNIFYICTDTFFGGRTRARYRRELVTRRFF
jgi:hypothetical protein